MYTTSHVRNVARVSMPTSEFVDHRIGELLSGIAHALPEIALGVTPLHTARSRAEEFRAAFAAPRKH